MDKLKAQLDNLMFLFLFSVSVFGVLASLIGLGSKIVLILGLF